MVKSLTPVLFAEEIEPYVAFWTERLGFTKVNEVPEGGKLGFVILQKDSVQVMYQSYASGAKDVPALATAHRKGPTFLFVTVPDLAEVMAAMKGVAVAVAERTTFYGSKEFGVYDPAGHVVLFAQFG